MFIVEVIPLSRANTIESLSYYSGTAYPIGSIIRVPIRKKELQAVVIDIQNVSAAKTAIKAATFSLKKLAEQTDVPTLPESILKTAQALAKQVPAHLGSILFSLLPPDVRSGVRPYPPCTTYENYEDCTPSILTACKKDRFISYRSHIRQSFAHRGSVLFVVPTSAAVVAAKQALEHGIEKRVVTFSGTHGKKQMQKAYEDFEDLSSAKLIIATPNFAFLDRHDITTIIMEESASPHYKARTRPYLDARDALQVYARITKRSLLMGDILTRTDEEVCRREESCHTFEEHPKRLSFDNRFTISVHEQKEGEKEFAIFTPEVTDAIRRTLQTKGRVFLYAARRGIAPLVTCYDCGYIFRCPDSGSPYSLFETTEGNQVRRWFISTTSGKKVPAADVCPDCSSWRLREQGIGIQQVALQARKLFANTPITVFDHSTANTFNKAQKLAKQFYAQKSSILIGTGMALPYLTQAVSLSAVTSYEAARAIPSWRAEEYLLALLLQLREKTTKDCYVMLRTKPDQLLKYASRGLIDEFYNEEIMMRQTLSYPPYTIFILLSWYGSKAQLKAVQELIEARLPSVDMQCYNEPIQTKKGMVRHALLRISREDYPDSALLEVLRNLPPYIKVEVNPDRII